MYDIKEITPGNPYACKFKVKTIVDVMGRPHPNLSDQPIKGPEWYEGFGVLIQRDMKSELVKIQDEKSKKEFVVPFSDIWDVDDGEWTNPLAD